MVAAGAGGASVGGGVGEGGSGVGLGAGVALGWTVAVSEAAGRVGEAAVPESPPQAAAMRQATMSEETSVKDRGKAHLWTREDGPRWFGARPRNSIWA